MNTLPTLAAELPRPMRCSCFETMESAYCGRTPNLRHAVPVLIGDTTEVPASINHNSRMIELIAKYGSCDMYAIAHGLELVIGDSIKASVTAGHAFGETLIEFPQPRRTKEEATPSIEVILWDDKVNFIWLQNSGVLWADPGIEAPEGGGIYVGAVRCEGGKAVEKSYLGRFELRAGNVVRYTEDDGEPGDTPDKEPNWFYTVTKGGVWLWDGSRYWKVGS